MVESIWNDSILWFITFYTNHSMGFTTTCLSISKNSTIITLHDTFDQMESTFIIYFSLRRVFSINCIICKTSSIVICNIWSWQNNLINSFLNNYTVFRSVTFLFAIERTASNHDLNALSFIWSINQWGFTHICFLQRSIMN